MGTSLEERRLRLSLALDLLAVINADDRHLLGNWLQGQPKLLDQQTHYTAVIDAQLTRITFLIDGPVHAFQPLIGDFITSVGASDSDKKTMIQLVSDLEPDQVGTWFTWSGVGVDGGWHLHGEFGLDDVLRWLPPQSALAAFQAWRASTGVKRGWQLRRSLGEPTPVFELDIDLEPLGADPMPSLQKLYKNLQAQWIGASLVDLFAEEQVGSVNLKLALTEEGLSRIGLIVPSPSRKLALLLGTLIDQNAHEKLARIEGMLGVEMPVQLVFSRIIGSWDVTYYYEL